MGSPSHPRDQESFHALQKGEDQALDRLIERWQQPLHKFAYHYMRNTADSRDLVAEVFVRLYQNRLKLRPNTNLSAWLFTTLSNLCCNQYRWRKRHPQISLDYIPENLSEPQKSLQAPAQLEPNQSLEKQEMLNALQHAIESLPHDYRITIILHHYNKLSYEEIAGIIKCSVRGVETRLYRAKQKLREKLTNHLRDGKGASTIP